VVGPFCFNDLQEQKPAAPKGTSLLPIFRLILDFSRATMLTSKELDESL
jgi:hypothetical protein